MTDHNAHAGQVCERSCFKMVLGAPGTRSTRRLTNYEMRGLPQKGPHKNSDRIVARQSCKRKKNETWLKHFGDWKMKNLKTAFVLLFALAVVSLSGSVRAAAGVNSGGLDPQTAAKISGIEQLVADYVQDVDWGPLSDAPN